MDSESMEISPLPTQVSRKSIRTQLCEDLLFRIQSFFSIGSLHKFKWVSKSWKAIILNKILPGAVKNFLLGFFFTSQISYPKGEIDFVSVIPDIKSRVERIDGRLSFMPNFPLTTIDQCNGLILLRESDYSMYCVCNPLNGSWTEVPELERDFLMLDFQPSISPHFKVYDTFLPYEVNEVWIRVYSSEDKKWKKLRTVHLPYDMDPVFQRERRTVWRDAIYMYTSVGKVFKAGRFETLRFGRLHDKDFVGFTTIKFPPGTEKPDECNCCMGYILDKMAIESLDIAAQNLKVWTVAESEDLWDLEYDDVICDLGDFDIENAPRIVGFDHLENSVYLLFEGVMFSYSHRVKLLRELCRVPIEDPYKLLPFYVCSSCYIVK